MRLCCLFASSYISWRSSSLPMGRAAARAAFSATPLGLHWCKCCSGRSFLPTLASVDVFRPGHVAQPFNAFPVPVASIYGDVLDCTAHTVAAVQCSSRALLISCSFSILLAVCCSFRWPRLLSFVSDPSSLPPAGSFSPLPCCAPPFTLRLYLDILVICVCSCFLQIRGACFGKPRVVFVDLDPCSRQVRY